MRADDAAIVFAAHFKDRFPREFGAMFDTLYGKGFIRNIKIESASAILSYIERYHRTDCYASVYSFNPFEGRKALVDTIFIDIDAPSLKVALKEAQALTKYLFELSITPRVYFSGAKGFHIYIDFKPADVQPRAIRKFVSMLACRLSLECIDMKVVGDSSRLSRLPFTINSKTSYPCVFFAPQVFLHKIDSTNLLAAVKEIYKKTPLIFYEEDKELPLILKKLELEFQSHRHFNFNINTQINSEISPDEALEIYRKHLDVVKETEKYIYAHCPFHPPDERPSFVVIKYGKYKGLFVDYHNEEKGYIYKFLRMLNGIRRENQ